MAGIIPARFLQNIHRINQANIANYVVLVKKEEGLILPSSAAAEIAAFSTFPEGIKNRIVIDIRTVGHLILSQRVGLATRCFKQKVWQYDEEPSSGDNIPDCYHITPPVCDAGRDSGLLAFRSFQ